MTDAGPAAPADPAGRRPRWAVLAGLVLLIVLAVAGVRWMIRPSPHPGAPPRAGRVTVLPASVDFGESTTGSPSRTREVTVRNGSPSALRIGPVHVAGDDAAAFVPDATACTRVAVAPGRSCVLRVRFVSTGAGARSGTLSVDTGAPDGPLTVALTGAVAIPALEVDHVRLDFGSQAVGARSAVQAIRVRNAGSAPVPLQVLPARSGSGSGSDGAGAMAEFPIVSSGCPMAPTDLLAAGQTCTIAVAFQPAGPGGRSAILAVQPTPPAGAGGGPAGTISVALAGVGTEGGKPPALVASSAEVDFGLVAPGARSPATTLTVSNAGGSRFQVLGVRVEGADAPEFSIAGTTCRSGSSLRPGGRCAVSLVFQPSGDAGAGSRSAMVVVDHAGPAAPVEPEGAPGLRLRGSRSLTVALTGQGAVAAPATDRTRENFGTLPLGTATGLRTLVVRNDGGAPLGVGKLVLAGADAADFVLSADRCTGETVDPGRTCTFAVGFDPRREGGRSATLVVPHDAGGTPLTIALSGAGVVAADLSVTIAPPAGPTSSPPGSPGSSGRSGPPGSSGPREPSRSGDRPALPDRWRIAVHNAGPRDATGVRLLVTGRAVSLRSLRAGLWRCEVARPSPRVTCMLPALPRSGRAVLELTVDVAGDEGVPSLTAAVRAEEPDPRPAGDKAHALVPIPGPATGR